MYMGACRDSLCITVVAASGYASGCASGVCIRGMHRGVHRRCAPGMCASRCESLHKRDHCIGVCIGYASGMNRACIGVRIESSPFLSNWVRGVCAHAQLLSELELEPLLSSPPLNPAWRISLQSMMTLDTANKT